MSHPTIVLEFSALRRGRQSEAFFDDSVIGKVLRALDMRIDDNDYASFMQIVCQISQTST